VARRQPTENEIRGNGTSAPRRNASRISSIIKHYWKSVAALSSGAEERLLQQQQQQLGLDAWVTKQRSPQA